MKLKISKKIEITRRYLAVVDGMFRIGYFNFDKNGFFFIELGGDMYSLDGEDGSEWGLIYDLPLIPNDTTRQDQSKAQRERLAKP